MANNVLKIIFFILCLSQGMFAQTLGDLKSQLDNTKSKSEVNAIYEEVKSLYLKAIIENDDALRRNAQLLLDQQQTYLAKLDTRTSSKFSSNSQKVWIREVTLKGNQLLLDLSRSVTEKRVRFTHLHDKKKNIRKNIYDIQDAVLHKPRSLTLPNGVHIKMAQFDPKTVRVVFYDTAKFYTGSDYYSDSLHISAWHKISEKPKEKAATTSKSATPPIPSSLSSLPVLLDKSELTIVIDPGHGGRDCGTRSSKRVCEKGIVLNVSKATATELRKLGYKAYLTRSKDTFIKLRSRTRIANKRNAAAFLSIHANALPYKKAALKQKGVETYFLARARTTRAKNVAAVENREEIEDMDYFAKETFLNVLNDKRIVASNKLAIDVQRGMLSELQKKYKGVVDGGVREGPFWVLVGAQMPSVLVEIGYLSHPTESERLKNPNYQKILARGIARGVDAYFQKNL